jgi:four helix bundle protein
MSFEPLENKRMYQRAEAIADSVWELVMKWNWFARRAFGCQWVEAADSIGANIAEAGGRYFPADVKRFLYYSRGSMRETKFWLRRAVKRCLITEEEANKLDIELEQVSREVNQAIRYQKGRQ